MSDSKRGAKCTKCGSTDTYYMGSGGRLPPGHPIASLAVGAYKAAQWLGAAPGWHKCRSCDYIFSAAPFWEG